jgi:predicted regulator of Ras-like GTPase activity (Roadblock/LC7/MglB family)
LRALFEVNTPLDLEQVLDHLVQFDGIEAGVLIEKSSGTVKASRGSDPARTGSFQAQAQQAYQKVLSLATELEVTEAESFNVRSNKGAMSFFNAPKVCLALLQSGGFSPGVQERALLATRELSKMI